MYIPTMNPATSTLRRLLAPLTATILVVLSVVVPMLDAGDADPRPVLESKHDAQHCVVGHDHTICSQVGTNRALPGTAPGSLASARLGTTAVTSPAVAFVPDARPEGRHSRAPPLARI